MLRGDRPEVVVISNIFEKAWLDILTREFCFLLIAELFKTNIDDFALVIHGNLPFLVKQEISKLRTDNVLPRIAKVSSPGFIKDPKKIFILIDGTLTEWSLANEEGEAWIICEISPPLLPNQEYTITRTSNDEIYEIISEE
jgi:hypothetical protein